MSIKREESFTPTPEDLGSPLTADSPGSPESGDKRKKDLTLPLPAGALPPRKRAKTENEKEQRRIERIMRNRQAAHASREKKRRHLEDLEKKCSELSSENNDLHHQVTESKKTNMHLMEQHYSLVAKLQQLSSLVNMAKSSGALAGVDVPDMSDVSMAPKLEMPTAAPSQPMAESTGSGSPSSTLSCDETDYLVDRARHPAVMTVATTDQQRRHKISFSSRTSPLTTSLDCMDCRMTSPCLKTTSSLPSTTLLLI
ncbi:hypothetical protein BD777DRAFT_121935 [Yarrowia lipolytica]|nr:hypothetical protein BD777DRAFT_121935 [Yarrowia lipolytica]